MRTFYIFKINKQFVRVANDTPKNMYILLNTIYKYNKKDIITAFNLFNELCIPINIEFFNKYIYDKLINDDDYTRFINTHMYHNYFNNEESKMIINKSHIKIKSNKMDNIFLNNLKDITDLFVCDFINEYYNYFKNSKEKIKK